MGRKRRRVVRTFKRTLPNVFSCPRCGTVAVKVAMKEDNVVTVACGSCNLKRDYNTASAREPIDIYNSFVDEFMAGKIGV